MSIVTFYSYKGGVGRSLALANVAVNLAKQRKRVLVIDWDLEAPGLEEYFTNFKVNADGRGLLFMLRDQGELKSHIWKLSGLEDETRFDFLPSGRDEPDYYSTLESFDPNTFFAEGGGDYLEKLRREWLERYDFVLIDSRTGLSDTGGICTILLPDIIVGLFTATRQSYRGVRDVLTLAQRSRQKLAYTRAMFSVLPVPCRLDETSLANVDEWIDEFAESMAPLTEDWLPKDVPLRDVLEELRVDHVPELSQGTTIISDGGDLGNAGAARSYKMIAALLDGDLQNVWDIIAEEDFPEESSEDSEPAPPVLKSNEYEYDLYISVGGGSIEARWVEELFLPVFRKQLEFELGRDMRIFFDKHELSAGEEWSTKIVEALRSSRALLPIISARSARSRFALHEWQEFHVNRNNRPIFPVLLSNISIPEPLAYYKTTDFRDHFTTLESNRYIKTKSGELFQEDVQEFASEVADVLGRST